MTVTRRAFAKINLTLDVGARRADGYHDVRSVMQTIALHDTLTVTRTPNRPGVLLNVTGPEAAGVPSDASNLVHQAAVRAQKTAAARGLFAAGELGLHIALIKRIPSQAGLGGGSSDAAAALLAVAAALGLPVAAGQWEGVAAQLGADVPFFLVGGTALVEGIGERVSPLPPLSPDWPLVVVKPPVGVSTKDAYAALDEAPPAPNNGGARKENAFFSVAAPHYWGGGVSSEAGAHLHNDFERVVLAMRPEVGAAHEALCGMAGRENVLLCGSGAALFCRASSEAHADRIAEAVTAARLGKVWVTRTQGANFE